MRACNDKRKLATIKRVFEDFRRKAHPARRSARALARGLNAQSVWLRGSLVPELAKACTSTSLPSLAQGSSIPIGDIVTVAMDESSKRPVASPVRASDGPRLVEVR